MIKLRSIDALSAGIFLLLSTATPAALIDNGGGLIYDDVLNITWSQPDTFRNWDEANTWASALTLGGANDWRLPYNSVAAGVGPSTSFIDCNTATELACRDNELGYMFYYNLGGTEVNVVANPNPDPAILDLSLFPMLVSDIYWSGTEFSTDKARGFDFYTGLQGYSDKVFNRFSWAVHPGSVGAVPLPAAAWLFGSGLLGLVGVARRKKAYICQGNFTELVAG